MYTGKTNKPASLKEIQMSSSAQKVQPNQAAMSKYTPPSGMSFVYTVFDLATANDNPALYVGVTTTNLAKRMQSHLTAFKSQALVPNNLAYYYNPTFTDQINTKRLDCTQYDAVLQIANLLVIGQLVPTPSRYKAEAKVIAAMPFLPCNRHGRSFLQKVKDSLSVTDILIAKIAKLSSIVK
jgi:hypothetical protein